MKLIIGLGNPGEKYKNTRHNVGFIIIEALAPKFSIFNFQFSKKFKTEIGQSKEIILAKPQTFMNLSGEAVAKIANFYKINPGDILVIHDDIDLPLGKLKIQKGGGTAGHHGLESIIKFLGTGDFVRFRIGIGRPKEEYEVLSIKYKEEIIIKHVLSNFTNKEWEVMEETIEKVTEAIVYYLENGLEKTMNKFN